MNPVPTTFKLDEVGSSGIGAEDVERSEAEPFKRCAALGAIDALNSRFEKRLAARFRVDNSLTRPLVSFQANKARAIYRWFKYKEAFSAGLVEHLLARQKISRGVLLDPFAGSGTACVAAQELGRKCIGIDVKPEFSTLAARELRKAGLPLFEKLPVHSTRARKAS